MQIRLACYVSSFGYAGRNGADFQLVGNLLTVTVVAHAPNTHEYRFLNTDFVEGFVRDGNTNGHFAFAEHLINKCQGIFVIAVHRKGRTGISAVHIPKAHFFIKVDEELTALLRGSFVGDFGRVRLTEGVHNVGYADRVGNRALRLGARAEQVDRNRNRFGDHD